MLESTRNFEGDLDELEALTQPGREADLSVFLELLHPADVAEFLARIDSSKALLVVDRIGHERAAEAISELDHDDQERLFTLLEPKKLTAIVGELETDDATDLIQEMDEATRQQVLAGLPVDDRKEVQQLLSYEPDTAGGLMQTELVAVPIESTVSAALEHIREKAEEVDIMSIFVVDDLGRYAGHLALQNLVVARPPTRIEQVMEPKVVEVTANMDQEEVARIFDRYSLVELGVVDQEGVLIGRITADDVHEVFLEEAEEDVLKLAGTTAEPEVIYSNRIFGIVGQRLPWLISTFFAGLLAMWILNQASMVFHTKVILLTFVPVITGMSGNVGTQSAMIMIQGMATGHIARENLGWVISRDLTVASIMALTCGVIVFAIVWAWLGNPALGGCVAIALAFSMVTASALGSTEPPVLKRFGIDPAIAAGPLITSINDVSGVLIYTMVSIAFLDLLP
ncbi:MAG: magnesium transporter [Myxococcales bacterium]|nr:magnesium transporter [Myxococcales bacterium]